MEPMLSYHNDPVVKDKYLSRVIAHAKADEVIKGKYWDNGKGCAVGCTIHSNNHAAYQDELGLPEWLARLEDTIFEGLPNEDAKTFPQEFLEAIPVGKNLDRVKWQFCAFVLKENIQRVLDLALEEKLKEQFVSSIRGVLALHESAIETGGWNESAAWSAESAAWSAAESAARSARSAARSAEPAARSAAWSAARSARSAARSAESAARSARSAAWSAESAAWSAAWSAAESAARSARSAAYIRYRDELLRLLRAA